jgi:CHAT domain-containing protein
MDSNVNPDSEGGVCSLHLAGGNPGRAVYKDRIRIMRKNRPGERLYYGVDHLKNFRGRTNITMGRRTIAVVVWLCGFFVSLVNGSSRPQIGIPSSPAAAEVLLWIFEAESMAVNGHYSRAGEFLRRIVPVAQSAQNARLEARCLMRLGDMNWNLGQMPASQAFYERSLEVARSHGLADLVERNLALLEIHRLYAEGKRLREERRNNEASLKSFLKAIDISNSIRSRDHEYKCLRQASFNYLENGDALLFYAINQRVREYAISANNRRELCMSYTNLGLYNYNKYNFSESLRFYNSSLDLAKKENEKRIVSENSTNIGVLYYELGDYDKAKQYIENAIILDIEIHDQTYYALDLNNLGNIYKQKCLYGEALIIYTEALLVAWEKRDDKLESCLLNNIGDTLLTKGEYAEALKRFTAAYRCAKDNKEIVSMALNNIANVHLSLKEYDIALDYYKRCLKVAEREYLAKVLWDAYYGMGKAYAALNNREKAIQYYSKSIDIVGEVRDSINIDSLKMVFNRHTYNAYEEYVKLLLESEIDTHDIKEVNELYNLVEKTKTQVLLESIFQSGREKEEFIERIAISDNKNIERYKLPVLQISIDIVQGKFLDDVTAIVEYYVSKSASIIFIITKKGYEVIRLPGKEALERSVRAYIKYLCNRIDNPNVGDKAAKRIYDEICYPMNKLKKSGIKKIIIVPDGILNLLPFEALIDGNGIDGNRLILDDFQVSYAPSISLLLKIDNMRPSETNEVGILAFGNPRGKIQNGSHMNGEYGARNAKYNNSVNLEEIPYSVYEVRDAARYFKEKDRNVFIEELATEEQIKDTKRKKYQIIHFACHGILDGKVPIASALILNKASAREDGYLQVDEIYDLGISANMVILSACQTGRGSPEQGEAILGLPRVFFFNGSKTVISTLWKIDDKPTYIMIKKMYSYLSRGMSKAQALQKAKQDISRTKYSHPYYWAGFVLTGDAEAKIDMIKINGPRNR